MTETRMSISRWTGNAVTLALFFGLSACVDAFYYKSGSTIASADRTEAQCHASSLEKAPVAEITTWERVCETEEVCDDDGDCREVTECSWESETVDVNADLRDRLMIVCMEDRGYAKVTLPHCSPAVQKAAEGQTRTVMPTLTEDTCFFRREDYSPQFVTPIFEPG